MHAFAVYCRLGDERAAAHELGISLHALKAMKHELFMSIGVTSSLEAARKMGWLKVPK